MSIEFKKLPNRIIKLEIEMHKKSSELNFLRVFVPSCLRGYFLLGILEK